MKKSIILLTLIFLSIYCHGQDLHFKGITLKNEQVTRYDLPGESSSKIFLKMTYGSALIENAAEIKKLLGGQIINIEIVFSDYPKGYSFRKLTIKRIENLKKINPQLFSDKKIIWKLIRQTECQNQESAEKLFHGIVITFSSEQKIKINKEIKEVSKLIEKQTERKRNCLEPPYKLNFAVPNRPPLYGEKAK